MCLGFALHPGGSTRAASPYLGTYYVAVGDSFSYGYLTAHLQADPQCISRAAPGFVCVFYRYLKRLNPDLRLANFSEPGADSCELTGTRRCSGAGETKSPLAQTVDFLRRHSGQVSPITLTIGGNDLLSLYSGFLQNPEETVAQLPQVFNRYRANLDQILSVLRSAAPSAHIIVTTQPNSLGGLASPPLPAGAPQTVQSAIDELNSVMKAESNRYGVAVADAAQAFQMAPHGAASLTYVPESLALGDSSQINIHPTVKGYRVYGDALIAEGGYIAPLTLDVRIRSRSVRRGGKETLQTTTSPFSTVRVKATLPGHAVRSFAAPANDLGTAVGTVTVGNRIGTAVVVVCATDLSDASLCDRSVSFRIR